MCNGERPTIGVRAGWGLNTGAAIAISVAALFVFSGCAAAVQSVRMDPSVRLRQFDGLFLLLSDASGSTSVSGAAGMGIASAQVMKGDSQASQALGSLQFEMAALGFRMANSPSDAELVGEFSIGQIRHDPIAGWIADQAMLVIKNRSTGANVAMFRAKSGLITPTVNNLISQIAKAVKQSY